jgi:predicted amidohydrolase YtcJ
VDQRLVDSASGIMREEAAFTFLRAIRPDAETQKEALHAAAATAHRLGITSVHAMLPPERIRLYMRERGMLKLRVTLCPEIPCLETLEALGIESGFGDEWLRLGGVKLFADGSIGAGNAALGKPYADSGESGCLNYSDEELIAFVRRCDQAGLQTVIHAIGDRAIEQVLNAHSAVGTSSELRHRIEHFELPTKAQIERANELGLYISMQPNFVGNWSGEGKMYVDRLGTERDRQTDPHRLVLDAGLPLAFGSDCMPMSPLFGLHWAVNAPHPNQRVSVEEAIACYTKAGAIFSFEEAQKGSLEVGTLADLVILNQDPRQAAKQLVDLQVEMTFVGGKLVYKRD